MAITEPEFAPPWGESVSASPHLVRPTDGFIQSGWPLSAANPTRGFFNWVLKQAHNGVRYFMTRGLPLWNSSETAYPAGAFIRDTFTDGAGFTRRSVYYLHGTAVTGTAPHLDPTNWSLVLDIPIAQATNWAREIWAWRNARQQRRFGIDHLGFPGGLVDAWEEDWSSVAFSAQTAAGNGSWGSRWLYDIELSGGAVAASSGINTADPNFEYISGIFASLPTPMAYLRPQTNGSPVVGNFMVESKRSAFWQTDDRSHVLEWQAIAGGTAFFGGYSDGSQIGMGSGEATTINGAAICYRGADTNWQLRTKSTGGGGTESFVDTGVAKSAGRRFRLETIGSNVGDDATARVRAYIDGAPVANAARTMNMNVTPYFRSRGDDTRRDAFIGRVAFRANLNPGDLFI